MEDIAHTVVEHAIPDHLIINMDETGLKIVPVDKHTLEVEGSPQVAVTGQEDKREITALVACTLIGRLLPPQLDNEWKTERCHPRVAFPPGWDIFHSESHRSTHATVERCVRNILRPWLDHWKAELHLPET